MRAVVLAAGGGVDEDLPDALTDLLDDETLTDALTNAGWEQGADGEPLPSAGVLDALRSAWEAS